MRDGTRVARAGLPEGSQGEPLLPGPTFAAKYHLKGEPSSSPFTYGRYHNPTWTRFEQALSELEGGPSVIFGSGIAAVTAVLSVTLLDGRPRRVLTMPSDCYYATRKLAQTYFASLGVGIRMAPTS